MAGYKPGVCNIGKNEIRKRYALGAAGLIFSAVLVYILVFLSMPKLYLLIAFIPLTLAFEGIYQGYFGFCVGFASKGIYDFEGSDGGSGKVSDEESHKSDMKKANMINLYSICTSLLITIITYLLFR